MKALITGATGFIGSHLVNLLLREGFDVTCLVRNTSNLNYLDDLNIKLVNGDCIDAYSLVSAVKGVDYVFHLAGLTKAPSADDFYNANVKGTENLINAVIRYNPGIKRFFYLSSLAAAGPSHNGRPLNEECEPNPVSVYGKTKLEGERIVYGQKGNLPVTIIRPPAVYGPRDRDMLVSFKMIKFGIIPYWGKCYYSFIYVEDIVRGILLSALSEQSEGEVFFISDGNIYSIDDIINAISDALEKRPLKLYIPRFIMPVLGFIAERAKGVSIINSDKIREIRHYCWTCDATKIMTTLNFKPEIKIKEGAKWTADWYRIHQWL